MKNFQQNRHDNPEVDPLLIGTGWAQEDLEKPQILLESTAGDSHPGSRHLEHLVESAGTGVYKAGGPLAFVEEGDLISIDTREQTLDVVGIAGEQKNSHVIQDILQERAKEWKGFTSERKGVLGLFTRNAGNTRIGASMLTK